jgi:uncharacterized protein YqeY
MLNDKINKNLTEALKQKNTVTLSVLRLLKAHMKNYMIEKKLKELKDEDIYGILKKQAKQHRDSIEQFKQGQRPDLVQKEEAELKIIQAYLPKPLSEGELKTIVRDVINEIKPDGKKDFGKVMKAVMERAKGRADGKAVNKLVNEMLT